MTETNIAGGCSWSYFRCKIMNNAFLFLSVSGLVMKSHHYVLHSVITLAAYEIFTFFLPCQERILDAILASYTVQCACVSREWK